MGAADSEEAVAREGGLLAEGPKVEEAWAAAATAAAGWAVEMAQVGEARVVADGPAAVVMATVGTVAAAWVAVPTAAVATG